MLCDSCLSSLKLLIVFRKKCLNTEKQLQQKRTHERIANIKNSKYSSVQEIIENKATETNDNNSKNPEIFLKEKNYEIHREENYEQNNTKEKIEENSRQNLTTTIMKKRGRKKMMTQISENKNNEKKYFYKIPCHLCGKLYDNFHLKFHMNMHNGKKKKML